MNKKLIVQGMKELCLLDDDIAQAFAQYGLPEVRPHPKGFEAFLRAVINQQLSIKAAASILNRVLLQMEECTAEQFLAIPAEKLREAGLSYRKSEYAQGIAEALLNGSFNIDSLQTLDDEQAVNEITRLRGLGRWSAEIYLMFSQERLDIFPADDLGIMLGLQKLKRLTDKPSAKEARQMVSHWSPWRSVGAIYLWHCYNAK